MVACSGDIGRCLSVSGELGLGENSLVVVPQRLSFEVTKAHPQELLNGTRLVGRCAVCNSWRPTAAP